MNAGTPPKPPAGKPPPAVKPTAAVTPKAAPVAAAPKPAETPSREEIRGIAHAIARAESNDLRDDLVARIMRIEERIGMLEKRPAAPPAPAAFAPIVPAFAPVPAPAPAPASGPASAASLPPAPAPLIDVPVTVDDTDLPFVSGARRRKRLAMILLFLLFATVGTIVVAAIISQAMNNHS